MKKLNLIAMMLITMVLTSVSYSQNSVVRMNDGETIIAYNIVDNSSDFVTYSYYFTNPSTGIKMTTLSQIRISKTNINYYAIGNDTTYFNFILDGVVFSKGQMLNKLMIEDDPQSYYQEIGYNKIGSAGIKLIGGTLVSASGGIISSSILLDNGNFKAASGITIGASIVSLGLILSAGVDLIMAKRNLKKSMNQKEKKYHYKGVLLN